MIFLSSLPVLLWWDLRQRKSKNQRRHDRFMMNTNIRLKVGDRELVAHMSTSLINILDQIQSQDDRFHLLVPFV